jgi:crotonobetaine/carnitine-CoA ligase
LKNTSGIFAFSRISPFSPEPGSIGNALPWMDVAVFDENDREIGPGESGEIRLKEKIPDVFFKEYFRNPEATAERWRDGWFCTGDGGRIDDDGELFYGQRLSDSIRHKGENISAWEIESVVLTHPNVEECAVIGVPGELGEQDIKLFVKPRQGDMDFAELERFCRERLARHQLPRYFESVDEFPKTPTERIAKHLLSQK